jgi:uncharacterized protein YuzE
VARGEWDSLLMRISFDPEADAAYIYVVDQIDAGDAVRQVMTPVENSDDPMIVLDFDSEGCLLGIEVLGASHRLRAETLKAANRPA